MLISWAMGDVVGIGVGMSSDMEKRRGVRSAFGHMAKEMGFAVNSIRQEVVERPWFERTVTPELTQEWDNEIKTDDEKALEGPQDFSRDDLYGQDPADIDRDIEDGREHLRDRDIDR